MLRQRGIVRGAGPEHNLIQNPQLTRSIQQVVGTRQPHVAPVLSDTVQPVVIADDVRDYPLSTRFATYAIMTEIVGDGIQPTSGMWLVNPLTSAVAMQILRVSVYAVGSASFGGTIAFSTTDIATQGSTPGVTGRGFRMQIGQPPVGRSDFLPVQAQQPTSTGYTFRRNGSVISPYWWAKDGQFNEDEVFFRETGVNLVLLPGGILVIEIVNANADAFCNFFWNEVPL